MKLQELPLAKTVVIDGSNKKMGRLASIVAKLLLEGHEVIVTNAEKIVITGNRQWLRNYWYRKIYRSDIGNPRRYGPKISVRPDLFFKRVVRGMLPRKQWKGRYALKRLKVYLNQPDNIPKDSISLELQEIDISNTQLPRSKIITLGELLKLLGWKGE